MKRVKHYQLSTRERCERLTEALESLKSDGADPKLIEDYETQLKALMI